MHLSQEAPVSVRKAHKGPSSWGRSGCALAFCVGIGACVSFPDVPFQGASTQSSDYPTLLPLDDVLAAPEPLATEGDIDDLQSRLAALQAKVARLQGPVIEPAQRRRMERGVR